MSGNRAFLLGGHPGDDTLGYDFRIARRSGTLLFEVKATNTDQHIFDISDRELAAAKAARKGAVPHHPYPVCPFTDRPRAARPTQSP